MTKRENKEAGAIPLKNKNHELFCHLYSGNKFGKIFGNATLSYMNSFGFAIEVEKNLEKIMVLDERKGAAWKAGEKEKHKALVGEIDTLGKRNSSLRKTAAANGDKLLRNTEILRRIDYLFDVYLNPDVMDREMSYVMAQRDDLISKVAAYREVAKVRGRVSNKIDGELVVRWEDDSDEPDKKKKTVKKASVKKVTEGIEWQE